MNLPFHGSDVRTHKIEGITITVNIVLLDNKLMESMQPTDFEDCDLTKCSIPNQNTQFLANTVQKSEIKKTEETTSNQWIKQTRRI